MKKTKNKERLKKSSNHLILIINFMLFMITISIFWIGFHNIDRAFNLQIINYEFEEGYVEITFSGDEWDVDQAYTTGFIMVFMSFLYLPFVSFPIMYKLLK